MSTPARTIQEAQENIRQLREKRYAKEAEQAISKAAGWDWAKLEVWPTSEGLHLVAFSKDRDGRQVGVLWI